MTVTETLENRGIPQKELISYLTQLGGIASKVENGRAVVRHKNWLCVLISKPPVMFMHSEIPVVIVKFEAEKEQELEKILKKFRLKTFRAGG
ncbi:hypothetical protein [Salipaludibacillus aurantiacus]|uniref:Molybdopterin cofactor biosynthesis MoaD-related C-terminal domain-containing protein n=1 Tax=Salipaludibacillus aurantiacus TaxID=1601833 RepID=A0A1H9PHE6_9BACI|nr:hypothetical protein [Salipaludibacillus aurantiacus]SER47279.1 hypothetical protein SAMN05518684_101305 [Salipaludibacillus aurantiacus]